MVKEEKIDLLILSNYGSKKERELEDVSLESLLDLMNTLDWNLFHQLMISRSSGDWVEVSGNLQEDGLSSAYGNNEEFYLIEDVPSTVKELIDILISFYKNDGEFKRNHKYLSDADDKKIKKPKEQDFAKWQEEYQIKLKKDKKRKGIRIFLTLLIFLILSSFFYYSAIGELQFIGRKTDFTEAIVVDTKMHHIGDGYYMQTVRYEFEYEGKSYTNTFEAGWYTGKRSIGDIVKIKFAISDPDRSSMVEVYNNKRKRNRR